MMTRAYSINMSLLKAISVIKTFTPSEVEMGPGDIARKTGIPLTTAHRILTTLVKGGLLDHNPRTGKYKTSLVLYIQGSLYLKSNDFYTVAEPILKELNYLTSEMVNLCVLSNGNMTIVSMEESKHHLRLSGYVGYTGVAYAHSGGKALLSEFSEAEIDEFYPSEVLQPLTRKTVATKTELKRELEQIRKTGVAFNIEQSLDDEESVASVVRDASGKAVASVVIALPLVRMNEAKEKKLVELVRMGAKLISYRLGYRDPAITTRDIQEISSRWQQN